MHEYGYNKTGLEYCKHEQERINQRFGQAVAYKHTHDYFNHSYNKQYPEHIPDPLYLCFAFGRIYITMML